MLSRLHARQILGHFRAAGSRWPTAGRAFRRGRRFRTRDARQGEQEPAPSAVSKSAPNTRASAHYAASEAPEAPAFPSISFRDSSVFKGLRGPARKKKISASPARLAACRIGAAAHPNDRRRASRRSGGNASEGRSPAVLARETRTPSTARAPNGGVQSAERSASVAKRGASITTINESLARVLSFVHYLFLIMRRWLT